jgi:hypothetical protein
MKLLCLLQSGVSLRIPRDMLSSQYSTRMCQVACPGYLDYPFQNKRFGHGSLAHFSSLQHLIFSKTLVC